MFVCVGACVCVYTELALLNGLHKQSPMKGLPGKQSSMSLGLQVPFLVSYCWNLLRVGEARVRV